MLLKRIVNGSGHVLTLKEGNAGVYSTLAEVSDGDSFIWSFDPSATYREIHISSATIGEPLIVSSDELADFDVVTVGCVDGKLKIQEKPRSLHGASSKSSLLRRSLLKFQEFFHLTK